MNSFLDHYCERVTTVTWDEPFNIFSNLAFLLVAYFIYQKASSNLSADNKAYLDIWILTGLIVVIGTGSATWHVLAEYWALWIDRIPILIFISLYLLSCLVRILRLSVAKTIVIFCVYHLINSLVLAVLPAETLNGSLFYIPTAIFLFGINLMLWLESNPARYYFTTGSVLFFIAIFFRTIDLTACAVFPVGTHFVWHLLVASTIYVLMLALIDSTNTSLSKTQ